MYALRRWSANRARPLRAVYDSLENVLVKLHPLLSWFGYRRIDKVVLGVEKITKGLLFDSQSCGQCLLSYTGMVCPMNCPKSLRNGPCGGVRANGKCEVNPEMECVWVLAWEGNKRLGEHDYPIQVVQPPVDNRLRNTSAWLREVRKRTNTDDFTRQDTA
jgi:hypothetical protein